MLTEENLLELIKKGSYLEADCSNCKKSGYYFYPEGTRVVTLGEKVSISAIKHDSCGHVFYELLCTCGVGGSVDRNFDDTVTCPMCKKSHSITDFNSGDVFGFLSKDELPAGVKKVLRRQELPIIIFLSLIVVYTVLKIFGVNI